MSCFHLLQKGWTRISTIQNAVLTSLPHKTVFTPPDHIHAVLRISIRIGDGTGAVHTGNTHIIPAYYVLLFNIES